MSKRLLIALGLVAVLLAGTLSPLVAQDTTSADYWKPKDKPGPNQYNGYCYLIFAIGACASCYFVFKGTRRI